MRNDPEDLLLPRGSRLRYLAFYLPQFHPIPENDVWWGEGFTEWTNVRKAKPVFSGHYQPHVPADDLGFYDLRDRSIGEHQAELARAHGITGFVYYHYWFHGRRLLERPLDDVLASAQPPFPFCLCWANENWSRNWDGGDRRLLMKQTYGDQDDLAHIRWLATVFADERYIRIDGRPLLLVYRASDLPDARHTTDNWRREAARLGVGDLYLCRVEAFDDDRGDPYVLGFDAALEFQPDWRRRGPPLMPGEGTGDDLLDPLNLAPKPGGVFSYPVAVELALTQAEVPYKRYRCVMPGWDNSPRRQQLPTIFLGSTPFRYERWLHGVIDQFDPYSPDENMVFINAWNEWGEGNHLEPDQRWGSGYLAAHLRATGTAPASATGKVNP
jgi:lipopolysaccharide biosynthesis protein